MAHILILAALDQEADALLPQHLSGKSGDIFPHRRLTYAGHRLTIVTTGLGKVNAAMAAGRFGPEADLLMMIGTCGALVPASGAYWISGAVQHDYGEASAAGFIRYRAGDWPMGQPKKLIFTAMADADLGLPHACIASGDSFMADPVAAAEMRENLGVQLVDMEVAAIAQVAAKLSKPWAAIKAVTDDANDESGGDFHANLCKAARQAAEAMERLIARLG